MDLNTFGILVLAGVVGSLVGMWISRRRRRNRPRGKK
jgi:LPXTG-motif cell wall-anchored protein